jgi:hypothetical protein
MRFCDESDKGTAITFCANLRKNATETMAMIRQMFRALHGKPKLIETEKDETGEEQI